MIGPAPSSISAKRALVPPMSPINAGSGMSSAAIGLSPAFGASSSRLGDEDFGGAAVEGHGDVVDDRKAGQGFHIDVVRQRRHRIDEEEERRHDPLGDQRADLLIAADRTALQSRHRKAPAPHR